MKNSIHHNRHSTIIFNCDIRSILHLSIILKKTTTRQSILVVKTDKYRTKRTISFIQIAIYIILQI